MKSIWLGLVNLLAGCVGLAFPVSCDDDSGDDAADDDDDDNDDDDIPEDDYIAPWPQSNIEVLREL